MHPQVTFPLAVPSPPAPLLPESCLPLSARAGSQPTCDTFSSPGALWVSPAHGTVLSLPYQQLGRCPEPFLAEPGLAEWPCQEPSMWHQHTLLGTKPMSQGSCFHLFHCPEQDCYPEPTQMPLCLLTPGPQSPSLPLSRSSSHPRVPALTPEQVKPGPERANLDPQMCAFSSPCCLLLTHCVAAFSVNKALPMVIPQVFSLVPCLGSADQTPAGDCSYANTGVQAQRPEHLFDTKPRQPSKG